MSLTSHVFVFSKNHTQIVSFGYFKTYFVTIDCKYTVQYFIYRRKAKKSEKDLVKVEMVTIMMVTLMVKKVMMVGAN